MTSQEVVEAGRLTPLESFFNSISTMSDSVLLISIGFIFVASVGFASLLVLIAFPKLNNKTISEMNLQRKHGVAFICFLVISAFGLTAFTFMLSEESENGEMRNEWKQHYAFPYIESLETHRFNVEAVDRVSDPPTARFHNPPKGKETVVVDILYTDEHNDTRTLLAEALINFESEDTQPRVEYKRLPERLGPGFEEGPINVTLFLPKRYYTNP